MSLFLFDHYSRKQNLLDANAMTKSKQKQGSQVSKHVLFVDLTWVILQTTCISTMIKTITFLFDKEFIYCFVINITTIAKKVNNSIIN